ncbi:hypothetical protein GOBAR_DD20872 [Gossypium barbadense]|nr:hypothetical protein GOBAR_DD20872 [Gossypium barbadense]
MAVITNGNPERPVKRSIAGIVEAMSTMEINETHVENKLCFVVYKEQFELEIKVHNIPCDHMSSDGRFTVDRLPRGIRGGRDDRDFPKVYIDVDDNLNNGWLP